MRGAGGGGGWAGEEGASEGSEKGGAQEAKKKTEDALEVIACERDCVGVVSVRNVIMILVASRAAR